jgi:hypothetical protein
MYFYTVSRHLNESLICNQQKTLQYNVDVDEKPVHRQLVNIPNLKGFASLLEMALDNSVVLFFIHSFFLVQYLLD